MRGRHFAPTLCPVRRSPPHPAIGAMVAVLFFGAALVSARNEIRVHLHGTRVLARIASVSRHRGGASTRLTYTTNGGEPMECTVGGDRGRVGSPVWLRYLPAEPSLCSSDDTLGFRTPIYFGLVGLLGIVMAAALYRRARDGESVRPK